MTTHPHDGLDAWEDLLTGTRSSTTATATPQVAAPTSPSPARAGEGSTPAPAGAGEGVLPAGVRRVRRASLSGPQPIEDLLAGQDQDARSPRPAGVRPPAPAPVPVPMAKPATGAADGSARATATPDDDGTPTAPAGDGPDARRQSDADGGGHHPRRPPPGRRHLARRPDDPTTPGNDDTRRETDDGGPTTPGPDGGQADGTDTPTDDAGGEETGARRRRPWRRRPTPAPDGTLTGVDGVSRREAFAEDLALARRDWADAADAARESKQIVVRHTWDTVKEAAPDYIRMDRVRSSTYYVSAAAAGNLPTLLGHPDHALPALATRALESITASHSISGAIVLAVLLAAATWFLCAYPTREWPAPLAWVCRIPTASVVLGSLLWDPAWNNLNL
ncbi:hypothetical protein [Streptomyces sp. ST2-7A]|uniref:hypothetical protein n=1 Tax=Streptomyces sp. ST2-7A TaxID=2907214 RepID=UPI001F342EEE|nr:hypothetical protein [Streptomyces sp. ST2-7A]MCE7081187.1 hypothetical protein [Streptomyces sp. ST2-7A]